MRERTPHSIAGRVSRGTSSLATFLALTVTVLALGPVAAVAQNQIITVAPDSAQAGASGVPVTFTLSTSTPLPPPAGVGPDSATLGSISGTALTHTNRYIVTADFSIPAGEPAGARDAVVTFTTPQGTLTFSKAGGFTVLAAADAPAAITGQPQSQIAQSNATVNFSVTASGTLPLDYQWQKDTADLAGDTNSAYTIAAATESDEGSYRCVVSNAFGVATSEAAVLTVTDTPAYEGYNLFAPNTSTNTYLMDNNGNTVHTWSSAHRPGQSVYLLEDGTLMRTANTGTSAFGSGGAGGRVEQYDWDGNLLWAYGHSTAAHCQHHDIEVLPNGNVLMISWELKTQAEAIAAGRDPTLINDGELWPDYVLEVQPTGTYGGTIVWEWHAWDHLVQDYDAGKTNFGSVADHPELIDLNFSLNGSADWHHINSVAYNASLDQIVLSVHSFSEIWVIDHSTTTEEATGHSGGNSGMGGDLLYRWGNPRTYDAGTTGDQQLYGQHDAEWIADGLPGAGNILIFNNGLRRSGDDYSTIDEITPPLAPDGTYTNSSAYGPAAPAWTYTATPATNFYAMNISGSQRLPNGNTLICQGPDALFFEVTAGGDTVWEYAYPGAVFRVDRYGFDYPGLDGTGLDPGEGPAMPYAVVDTGQEACYDTNAVIAAPAPGQAFAGQDAQYMGNAPRYIPGGDGLTVRDINTGLTWQQSPDTNGNGIIEADDKLTWARMQAYPARLNAAWFGGYNDWRLPSIKELYSLIDFRGTDPMVEGTDTTGLVPFIDTNYFAFAYGDTGAGERIIDSQYGSSNLYVTTTGGGVQTLFGVNFADGRIKGYGLSVGGSDKTFLVLCCRGNPGYGVNAFTDGGDGTVTDNATGLMWQQADSATGLTWQAALAYAEGLQLAGYRDWRLPNAKELQSILDYTRSPATHGSAAIDPVFACTVISNELREVDYPWYWSGTTHARHNGTGSSGAYVCFGRGMGYMNSDFVDIHGAGCQRSDPKGGSLADYTYAPYGYYMSGAPQGDAIRMYNYVRCVRAGATAPTNDIDDDGLSDWYEWNYASSVTGLVATADDDDDGVSNGDEEGAGTSPTDPDSLLLITGASATASGVTLAWSSELGKTYALQCTTNLATNAVTTTVASGIPATPPVNVYSNAALSPAAFYAVAVE